ncbi:MAG: hypothetical protein Tsb0014_26370 [Pleurocapsa sp.]
MTLAIQTGNETITAWDILPRLARYQMLPQLVKESIIDDAIATIECTPEEIAAACQKFYQQHQLTTKEQRQAWCQRHGMDEQDIIELATRPIKIAKFKQDQWGENLNRYFVQRKDNLDQVIFSIIRVSDMGLAQEIYFRIQEGQYFAELAKTFSEGKEAQTGGMVNPVELGKLPPAMAQLLRTRQAGELLPPFPMGDSIVIIRVESIIPAQLDDVTRQRLLEEKFQTWLQSELKQRGYQINQLDLHSIYD